MQRQLVVKFHDKDDAVFKEITYGV
jgi:hypothetical protein